VRVAGELDLVTALRMELVVRQALEHARLVAVDRRLWAHDPDGVIRREWAPASPRVQVPAGAKVEVSLDEQGAVNGWWHVDSGLAVNQRRLAPHADPVTAAGLARQGSCGVLWRASAAARLLDNEERCLTCAGALALV
jgi:hypothetical protein